MLIRLGFVTEELVELLKLVMSAVVLVPKDSSDKCIDSSDGIHFVLLPS